MTAVEPVYGPALARVYDMIYAARGKGYAAEAAAVANAVAARCPDAASLLDIACGTGAHLVHFRDRFADVAGLDRSADMLTGAAETVPGVPVHLGDMTGFDLGRTFDAAACMFSSVGYLRTAADLDAAVSTATRHVRPGGVVVIEPWYPPEEFVPGYVAHDMAGSRDDQVVARVSHSTRDGRHVSIVVHYLVADRDHGVRHFTDVHEMTLFERTEYAGAFERAGCAVELLRIDRFPCGLYVGVRS